MLAIQCFLPEIWTGMNDESDLITWKNVYHTSWINTGIPFIHDLTPGYDAHIVFPSSPVFGNTQSWRDLQTQAINDFGSQSFTFNAWNGYTEGFAGVPTVQYGDASYNWICTHFGGNCTNSNELMKWHFRQENLEILPNPVLHHMKVHLKDQGENIISYKIVTSKGIPNIVWKAENDSSPVFSIDIDMGNMFTGLYLLKVQTERSTYVKKILKVGE